MVLDRFTSRGLGSHDNASCRIDRWSLGLSLEILHGSRNTGDCGYEGAEPIKVSKGQTSHPGSPLHGWDCSAALPPLRIRWGSLCPAAAATSPGARVLAFSSSSYLPLPVAPLSWCSFQWYSRSFSCSTPAATGLGERFLQSGGGSQAPLCSSSSSLTSSTELLLL